VNLLSFLECFKGRAAVIILWVAFLPFSCSAAIRYEVSLAHPEHHLFRVTMLIPDVSGEVTVQMPSWNALYQIRDFSSHLQDVEAFVGAEKVPILRVDKLTWRIRATGTVRVQYATSWDEPGPFSTQLNGEHGFINPAMILMYVVGGRQEKVALNFGDFPHEWRAEGALLEGCKIVFDQPLCREEAANYDELVDAPIEIGKFDEFDLSGVSPRITVAVHGDNWQKKKIEELLTRICQYEIKLMEGAPFEHYTFIVHVGKAALGAGGGMEHANSTAISCGGWSARIFSFVEREAHPASLTGAGGLCEGAVFPRVVVCGRSHEHLRFVHLGANGDLEQTTVLRRPRRTDRGN